jgi:hypothetical protein
MNDEVSLDLNNAPRHDDVWGSEIYVHAFSTSAVDRREWSASRPDRFASKEGAFGTPWIVEGWVGPRTDMNAFVNKETLITLAGNRTQVVRSVA